MICAGIDPGKTGACVILYPDNSVTVLRVPLTKKPKEVPAWIEWAQSWSFALSDAGIDRMVIENVASRPEQGVTSMFTFGRTLGFAHSMVAALGIETHFITPQAWKAKLGLIGADKNASREKARGLFPRLTPHIGRVKDGDVAEAALMAYYGRKFL